MIAGLQQKLWTCDFCFHQELSAFSNGSFQVFILWEKPFYYELKLIGPLGRDRPADDRPDRTGTRGRGTPNSGYRDSTPADSPDEGIGRFTA